MPTSEFMRNFTELTMFSRLRTMNRSQLPYCAWEVSPKAGSARPPGWELFPTAARPLLASQPVAHVIAGNAQQSRRRGHVAVGLVKRVLNHLVDSFFQRKTFGRKHVAL